ncbi:MAG: hypothetical protein JO368_02535, partial [Acidimicrobiales bacterium]|nr:hypothetical protein [Acidimicrobiales bacterium]
MEPINYAAALWRSWRLLLVLGIVGAIVAVVLPIPHAKQQKPVLHYSSWSLVGAVPKGGSNILGGGVTGQQIQFYASSLTVEQDAAKAIKQNIPSAQLPRYMSATLGYPKSSASSGGNGSTTTVASTKAKATATNVVTLNTFGTSKKNAQDLANSWAIVLGDVINATADSQAATTASAKAAAAPAHKTTSTTSSTDATAPTVNTGYLILDYAVPAQRAPGPAVSQLNSRKVRLPLGFLGGVLVGALVVLVRMLLDRRLRTPERAAALFGYPVIAEIPERPPLDADQRAAPVDVVGQPTSPEAEAFRMLRMSVLFEAMATGATASGDPLAALFGAGPGAFGSSVPAVPGATAGPRGPGERRVIMIVSPGNETTRPMVAANLAAVCAESGEHVIVVSTAEMQTGRIFGSSSGSRVTGEINPDELRSRLEPTRVPNISRLPLSLYLEHSSQLVSRGKELLEAASAVSDMIIVEAPAILSVHHAEALSHAVDLVVVIGECGTTRLSDARKAGDLLRRIGAPVLGVVLTNVRASKGPARRRTRGVP